MFYNALTGSGYSPKNVDRLMAEYDGPETDQPIRVAGFRQWLKVGRVVRKGQHGHKIAMMVAKKVKAKDGETERKQVMKLTTVFFEHQTTELQQ